MRRVVRWGEATPVPKRRVLRSRLASCADFGIAVCVEVPRGSPHDYPLCFECPKCGYSNEQPP